MRKRLGEMLVEAGLIDAEQLRAALLEQRKWKQSLGRTLVEMRFVREPDLVRVLAAQFGMSTIDLDAISIPVEVIDLVPGAVAIAHTVVPFAQPMKFLDVAITDPQELAIIDELRIRTQLNVRPFLAGPQMMERALAKYYGHGAGAVSYDMPGTYAAVPEVESEPRRPLSTPPATPASNVAAAAREGLRPFPRTSSPAAKTAAPTLDPTGGDAVGALQARIAALEAIVARDEQVLRQLLALLIEKGVATREEILERLK